MEQPVDADLVIGAFLDSGTTAAIGYSEASGIPFGEGLVKIAMWEEPLSIPTLI